MAAKAIRIFFLFFCFTWAALSAQNRDIDWLHELNRGNMPAWDNTMKGVSNCAYPVALASPVAVWAHGYFKKDKAMMRNGYKGAATIVLAMGLSTGLKYTIRRQRPVDAYPGRIVLRDHSGTWSFPSGHTTSAFATATSLSLTYRKWYVALPAYTYAGFMGYSRMRLGMHYPSDVLGGIVLGVGSGWLVWQLDRILFRNRSGKPVTTE